MVILLPRLQHTIFVTTTSQEVCRMSIRNDVCISQVIMLLLACDSTSSQGKSRTTVYYTSALKCNGGVAHTHTFEYQLDRL